VRLKQPTPIAGITDRDTSSFQPQMNTDNADLRSSAA
jgi:hypothetical protein